MYSYHALINTLSAHMIHINLNMIFYTHVKHSPTETVYIKYYLIYINNNNKNALQTHTHTHTHTHTNDQASILDQYLQYNIYGIAWQSYNSLRVLRPVVGTVR